MRFKMAPVKSSITKKTLKAHVCGVCGEHFTTPANCRRHEKKQHGLHGGVRETPCPVCQKPWDRPSDLKRHLIQVHGCTDMNVTEEKMKDVKLCRQLPVPVTKSEPLLVEDEHSTAHNTNGSLPSCMTSTVIKDKVSLDDHLTPSGRADNVDNDEQQVKIQRCGTEELSTIGDRTLLSCRRLDTAHRPISNPSGHKIELVMTEDTPRNDVASESVPGPSYKSYRIPPATSMGNYEMIQHSRRSDVATITYDEQRFQMPMYLPQAQTGYNVTMKLEHLGATVQLSNLSQPLDDVLGQVRANLIQPLLERFPSVIPSTMNYYHDYRNVVHDPRITAISQLQNCTCYHHNMYR